MPSVRLSVSGDVTQAFNPMRAVDSIKKRSLVR